MLARELKTLGLAIPMYNYFNVSLRFPQLIFQQRSLYPQAPLKIVYALSLNTYCYAMQFAICSVNQLVMVNKPLATYMEWD